MIVVNSKEFAHCGSLPATVHTIFEKHADAYENKDIESDLVI